MVDYTIEFPKGISFHDHLCKNSFFSYFDEPRVGDIVTPLPGFECEVVSYWECCELCGESCYTLKPLRYKTERYESVQKLFEALLKDGWDMWS